VSERVSEYSSEVLQTTVPYPLFKLKLGPKVRGRAWNMAMGIVVQLEYGVTGSQTYPLVQMRLMGLYAHP